MSNKTECLRCGGGLKKRFDHYECVDCGYTSDDFHFEQNEEIKRLREALERIEFEADTNIPNSLRLLKLAKQALGD